MFTLPTSCLVNRSSLATCLTLVLCFGTLAGPLCAHDAIGKVAGGEKREEIRGEVVVACPDDFQTALEPWITHRRQQGYAVRVVNNSGTAARLSDRVQAAFTMPEVPRFIVLVGDAPAQSEEQPGQLTTATFFREANVNKMLGGGEDIATDNPFADFDGDGIPDAAVGRLPTDTSEELEQLVAKILNYERQTPGAWQRQINFIAGVGGFGLLADRAIEMGARKFITEGIPAAFRTHMTYASWQSPYYPGGKKFRQATLDRFNEGSLFCVYIGHGSRHGLDFVRERTTFMERYHPILQQEDVAELTCEAGPPIALFLACYTGSFDGDKDSLAEDLLRRQGGPVAAVCGSRVTMPYAMSVLGNELIHECFNNGRRTLGELLQHAKRGTMLKARNDENSKLLDNVAALLNVHGDLTAEREEHLSLFNLIGDPVLQIGVPEMWELKAPQVVRAGDTIQIRGVPKFAADVQFELVVTRNRLTFEPPQRQALLGGAQEVQDIWQTYQRANQQTLSASKTLVKPDKEFCVSLRIPADATGECHVRMFAAGKERSAVGSADLTIE